MPTWKGCIYDERPSHGYPDVIRGQKSAYGNSAAAQLTGAPEWRAALRSDKGRVGDYGTYGSSLEDNKVF